MIRLRRPVAVIGFLLFLAAAAISAASANPIMPGAALRTLPNGLRLLVREQHSAELVAVDAWVRAGSGRQAAGEEGAAHFLEHLLFKGTTTRNPGEIDGAIEDLGATLSAFTTRDSAHFCTTVPSAHANIAVEVIADALRNSLLDPAEVEKERRVILDELARGRSDARKEAINSAFSALMPGHPYARPVLGAPASIKALSRDSLVAFYRRWYTPDNTTVVLVGDITPDRAEELVKAAFGTWSGPSPEPRAPAAESGLLPAAADQSRSLSIQSEAVPAGDQFAAVAFGVAADKPAADAAAGLVVAALLGDSRTGRLATVRDANLGAPKQPDRVGADVAGEYFALPSRSLLLVGARVTGPAAGDWLKTVGAEIERLTKTPPTDSEMDAAQRQVIGPYLYDVETYAGQARALGMFDVLGDYTAAQNLVDAVLALKPSDITAFAQRYLKPEARADVILNPPAHP